MAAAPIGNGKAGHAWTGTSSAQEEREVARVTEQAETRGVAAGVEPLDQRRVSVVCRTTRIDLSLPAHLELVAVIPEVVELVRNRVRGPAGSGPGIDVDELMGGDAGGSWQLSRLAGGPLAVSETLAQQRVHDGEILVLDHRPVPTPAPLFDDVLQGLTDGDVACSPTWERSDAVTAAVVTTAVAALAAAAALLRQWWSGGGALTPVIAALLAAVAVAAVLGLRSSAAPGAAHTIAGVSALAFTVLAAATVGSAPAGAGHLIGGLTSGAVLAGVLRCTVFRVGVVAGGDGRPRTAAAAPTYPLAAGYLAATVTLTVGAIGAAVAAFSGAPVEAIGPALALTGLLLLTSAPRLAVSAARVPVPPVPAPGDDVEAGDLEDIDHDVRSRSTDGLRPRGPLPSPDVLLHRFLSSRSWLTGFLAAAGVLCTVGSLLALTGGPGPTRWAAPLALVLVVVLVLRGLGYADRVHTTILLASALALAAGVLAGASTVLPSPAGVVVPAAVAIAAAVVVAATVLPRVELSPAALRAVGTVEAILLCVIVPLAIGAMGIYSLVRQR